MDIDNPFSERRGELGLVIDTKFIKINEGEPEISVKVSGAMLVTAK